MKNTNEQKKQAIVTLGGSFCPVHQGHVNVLEAGARIAEERGYEVVGKYMVCSPKGWLQSKYGAELISS